MERAGVPVANALLPGGLAVDDVEWKCDFDELGWHQASSGGVARCQYACQERVVLVVSNGRRTSAPYGRVR